MKLRKELLFFLPVVAGYFYVHAYKSLGAYFSMDDINNISWSHVTPVTTFLLDALNPNTMATVDTYRPVGSLFYRFAYQLFGLHVLGYHLLAHALHLLNCLAVYSLIRKLHCGKLSALTGSLFFSFQIFMLPLYWEFSTIFDIVCALFMFLSFLFYIEAREQAKTSYGWIAISAFFFFLGVRSKEMAFALPPLFTLYELIFKAQRPTRKTALAWDILKKQWPFYLIAFCYFAPKALAALGGDKSASYGVALTWSSFSSGIAFYFFLIDRSMLECILILGLMAVACLLPILLKDKTLFFALLYVFLSFAPVIFLQNHRWHAYWYIPEFGIALYLAGLIEAFQKRFVRENRKRLAFTIAGIILLFGLNSFMSFHLKIHEENWYAEVSREDREFVEQLSRQLPSLPEESVIVFFHAPRYYDEVTLASLIHTIRGDWSVTVRFGTDAANNIDPDVPTFYVDYQDHRVTVSQKMNHGDTETQSIKNE